MKTSFSFLGVLALGILFLPNTSLAQSETTTHEAVVIRVIGTETKELPHLGLTTESQTLEIQILDDEAAGQITIENDYIPVSEGDRIFIRKTYNEFTSSFDYGIVEIKRTGSLWWLFGLFASVILIFGGWQGVRSLISLAASLFIILYLLVPTLASGAPPILTSVGIAFLVMFGAVFFTHGFHKKSVAAFLGAMVAICVTGVLAWIMVGSASLTGFSSDESVYLNVNTGGTLDFAGLLLGAIIIGVLGVLDDIAITQVAVVGELLALRRSETLRDIFWRASKVGREHVAALVNTLVLAYTGAALPLLLWVSSASTNFALEANREVFAVEIIRTLVGSIGLVLTVPVTTALAIYLLRNTPKEELEAMGGHHHH